jgi:hypothetical protein
VLEEPYLDNDVPLIYLRCIEGHETFDRAVLIDVERGRPKIYQAYQRLFLRSELPALDLGPPRSITAIASRS